MSSSSSFQLVRSRPRRTIHGKSGTARNPIVRTKLCSALISLASSTGASTGVVDPIAFNSTNFPEITSWDNVYDQCRVLGGTAHFRLVPVTAQATTGSTTVGWWLSALSVQFDSLNVTPAGVGAVMNSVYHSGPQLAPTTVTNGNQPSLGDTQTFHKLKFRVPNALAPVIDVGNLTASDTSIGRNWFPLQALAASPNILTLEAFHTLSVAQTNAVCTFYVYLELDVEFRTRT